MRKSQTGRRDRAAVNNSIIEADKYYVMQVNEGSQRPMKRIGYIAVLLVLILTVGMISPAAVTHASTEGADNDPAVGQANGLESVKGLEYSEPDNELPGGLNALEGTLITDGINSSLSGTEKPGTGSIVSVKSGSSGYSLKELGGNEYGYESLTDAEKMIFDAIGNELEDFIASDRYKSDLNESNSKIEIYCEISSGDEITAEDIAKVICRFVYSNPRYYWIGQQYWFGLEGDQASAAICVDPYYYDYFSRKATDDVISRQTEIWVDEIRAASNSAGDYYGALKAHDQIIRAADYAYFFQ